MALEQDIRFARLASGACLAWAGSGRGPPLLRAAHWMTQVVLAPCPTPHVNVNCCAWWRKAATTRRSQPTWGLAEKTVRNSLSQLYTRLGVEGRPQAVVRARELGHG